jgi:hypothetical protein
MVGVGVIGDSTTLKFGASISNKSRHYYSSMLMALSTVILTSASAQAQQNDPQPGDEDPVDLLVFDGDPADGNLIAWKTIFIPNENKCEGTWFN